MFNFVDIEIFKNDFSFQKRKKNILNRLVSLYVYFAIHEKGAKLLEFFNSVYEICRCSSVHLVHFMIARSFILV